MRNLLFEIGVEELPAGYIKPALKQLEDGLKQLLDRERIGVDTVRTAGTPRRLAVWAGSIPEQQAARSEEVVGPPAHVAYDEENNPTAAAKGFAQSLGIKPEKLEIKDTPKGPYVVANVKHPGKPATELLPAMLAELTAGISFPKSMRWPLPEDKNDAGRHSLKFARPIRRLTAMFGNECLPVRTMGLQARHATQGHPFLAPGDIILETDSFEDYCEKLKTAFVIPGYEDREKIIEKQLSEIASENEKVDMPEGLLEEVAGLVEYPYALTGQFNAEFLRVPECVLIAAMTKHQRYFPMRDADGNLLNKFVIVSNRTEHQADTVREGNERVLGARLADARFFWDEDRKTPLQTRVQMLKDVVYLDGLGNNLHRTLRLERLAGDIAEMMEMDENQTKYLQEAATLCKADLLTGLVGEFPSYQGRVGGELALEEGKPEPVARAIGEHYLPVSADGAIPHSKEGTALSLADKTDCIACCYALGHTPDGSQDPFAMRRNAIGILRLIEKKGLNLRLCKLLSYARDGLRQQAEELGNKDLDLKIADTLGFLRDRLYHDALARGYRHDIARAALSTGFDRSVKDERLNNNVKYFWMRLSALVKCSKKQWWPELIEVVDRTFRIQKELEFLPDIDRSKLSEKEEIELVKLLDSNREEIISLFKKNDFSKAAAKYCEVFAEPVHAFFEEVFVNVEDDALRMNRKTLCGHIYRLFADYLANLHLVESAEENLRE